MTKRTEEQKKARKKYEIERNEQYKKFYRTNLNLIQKCKKCGVDKQLSEFSSSYSIRLTCKKCHREAAYKWRKENRATYANTNRRHRKRASVFIKSLKEGKPCVRCGKKFPPHMLDFHHLRDKEWAISKLYGKSEKRILKEIEKCELLCVNCHREETQEALDKVPILKNRRYLPEIINTPINPGDETKLCIHCNDIKHINDFSLRKTGKRFTYCKRCTREYNRKAGRNRKRGTKEFIKKKKHMVTCVDCNNPFPYWIMDADHKGEEKHNSISKLQGASANRIEQELKLCDIICANCHRERTNRWRQQAKRCICGYKPLSKADKAKHSKRCSMQENPVEDPDIINDLLNEVKSVRSNDLSNAKHLLNKYHYGGYGRAASAICISIFRNKPVAIIKFSTPVRKEVATSLGWKYHEVLELDRFCIIPKWQVKNLASKIMAQVIKLVKKDFPEVAVLVSFADSERGHFGTIYKASNWAHVGSTANSYTYVDANGDEVKKKTVYNRAVTNGMKEKEYAHQQRLVRVGIGKKEKYVYELR